MKTTLLVFGIVCLVAAGWAQPPVAWLRDYPPIGCGDQVYSVSQTHDGGYLISGNANCLDSLGWVPSLVIRTDSAGNQIWRRMYELDASYNFAGAHCVHELSDHGVTFLAATDDGVFSWFGDLVKTDSVGAILWERNLGCQLSDCKVGPDGGFILAGQRHNNMFLLKLDSDGYEQWSREYSAPGGQVSVANRVLRASDGGYLLEGGYQLNPETGIPRTVRTDSSGNQLSVNNYDIGVGWSWYSNIAELPNGDFILPWSGSGGRSGVVITDPSGALLAQRTFSGCASVNTVAALADGGFLAAGYTSNSDWFRDLGAIVFLTRCDAMGQPVWSHTYADLVQGYDVSGTLSSQDGGQVLAGGEVRSRWDRRGDVRLLKFCPEVSDAAYPVCIASDSAHAAYRLVHELGEIDRIVFTGFGTGMSGSVGGEAASTWTVMNNGDGNDGDSLIFLSSVPLSADSIDTLYVNVATDSCVARWSAGCRNDTVNVFRGDVQFGTFTVQLQNYVAHLQLTTLREYSLQHIAIWVRPGIFAPLTPLVQFAPANDSSGHRYSCDYTVPANFDVVCQFYAAATDQRGCQLVFFDVESEVVNSSEHRAVLPADFHLSSFPNPFNPATTLSFTLPKAERTKIVIYDIMGREVRTLSNELFTAGEHTLSFDGSALPSGIYFARMQSGEYLATQKLLLLK